MGTLSPDEKSMTLAGHVRVANNSGEDYENAQTRLIVGKIHLLDEIAQLAQRESPYGRPGLDRTAALGLDIASFPGRRSKRGAGAYFFRDSKATEKKKEIRKEGLSEYFLYTIEGTETIPDQWSKRLPSFEIPGIPVTSLYKYDEERWGSAPVRFVAFANDEEHELGQTPLPDGRVRIYRQVNEQQNLSYVGGADVKYIPVDEDVELNLGPARQVVVEPKLMGLRTDHYLYDRGGNVAGWDEIREWSIEVDNTREISVKVEVTRTVPTTYWKLDPGPESGFAKHDANHARFTIELPARSKRTINYTLTTYHGTREGQGK